MLTGTKVRRFLFSEPSNPLAASFLVTILLYAALILVRAALSVSLFQGMDFFFVPVVFVLALAARAITAKRRQKTS